MITLGLNSVYHESAAALVADGEVIAAAEEERFNRCKHAKPADVDNAHVMPEQAVRFCLDRASVAPADLGAISYSYDPALRRRLFTVDAHSMLGDWGSRCGEDSFLDSLDRVPVAIREMLGRDVPIHYFPHHLTHAASVFYTSCPEDAAVLVIDGIGEDAASVLFAGEGGTLRTLEEVRYPNSIGFLWEKLSSFLGFTVYDACKVMGLAAYGDPEVHRSAFSKMARVEGDHYVVDLDVLRFRLPDVEPLELLFGPARAPGAPIDRNHADVAAALQEVTNEIVLHLVNRLHALHPVADLALAGGVALNCTANYVLKERGPFSRLHVPTAPHDAGTAIGGALLVDPGPHGKRRVQRSAYIGPEFSTAEIDSALAETALPVERPVDLPGEVALSISRGAIVGWFQGRMEFGPRALGNRSLLADPRYRGTKDVLNHKVKHREDFRPFAPSVLAEYADKWFDLGRPSPALDAMLVTCPVRPDKIGLIPAVVHGDATARVQVVHREKNPLFHALISRFHELTGVPLLLNTSFNDSEPIVCSPRDAVRTFMSTRIDALAIGDRLVRRGDE